MKHKLLSIFAFLLVATTFSYAQRIISGVVTSAKDKQPLIGALVLVEKTSTGTSTDIDGKYSLSVPNDAKNLVVSYTGFTSKTILITGTTLNVALEENEKVLEDVVVTAQSVKREKRSLGYSTTTVNSEELNEASPISALDALQGKVAGAQITNESGSPGGSTRVVLRGGSSLTGDNNALIVVDGVPIDNSNFGFADVLNNGYDAGNRGNDINPEDIESVTVLKGAAAVALYGQRGANGAVLYTTKSGKTKDARKFKVTFSENITAEKPLKLPSEQNQFGQGSEDNYGNAYFDTRQNWSWGPAFTGQNMYWGTPVVLPNGQQEVRVKPYSAIPDNVSSFFSTGATYNSNLSIQGSDDHSSYYASFNNVKYDGIVPTTGYERNSLRLNASHDFGDHFTLTGSFTYTNTNSVLPISGQQNWGIMNLLLNTPRDIPMQELQNLNNPFNAPNQYYDPFYPNPYWALQQFKTTDNVDRFISNMNAEWKPTKWLNITERFGADIYTDTREQDFNTYSFYPIYYYQGQTSLSPTATSYIGKFNQDRYTVDNINSDLMATIHKDIHNWTFSLLLGNNIYSNTLKNTYAETNGLAVPGFYNLINSAAPISPSNLYNQTFVTRLLAVYGDLNIGYKNFLFLELTGRNDWSSTLPLDNRSYFYPGVGASLVFTELGKKKINPMILSFGKIRANFAQIATVAPAYSLTNFYVPGGISDGYVNTQVNSPYSSPANSNIPGWQAGNVLSNPTLKPEISSTGEVGTELGFLKDRLTVDATYYYKKTVNEILTVPIAPSTGYQNEVINAGVLQNQGVELAVHITPVSMKNSLKWEVYGTFTKNVSKVLQVSNGSKQIVLGGSSQVEVVVQKGQPMGSFYGAGVLTNAKGQVVVDSGVGTPLLSSKPSVLGNYQPTWLGSIGTSISYKGLKLTILFDGRDGGQFYSATAELQQFLGNDPATTYNNREPFVAPNSVYYGTGGNAGYHANTTKTGAYNYWYAVSGIPSYQMITASFVKLREIALTYAIPTKMLSKQKAIKGFSIKAFASNVWLWVPKSNTFGDPEVSSSGTGAVQGYEYYNLPSLRSFGGGFTAEF